jgi:hypothetical protein
MNPILIGLGVWFVASLIAGAGWSLLRRRDRWVGPR